MRRSCSRDRGPSGPDDQRGDDKLLPLPPLPTKDHPGGDFDSGLRSCWRSCALGGTQA
jgi:hypothetical protein